MKLNKSLVVFLLINHISAIKLSDDDQPYTITVDGVEFENDIFLKLDTNKKDE